MARGKMGDVVFSRLNGEQIARVRNRHPNNPRTNAQLYQRAIMATIMQAYSAGKVIFDHSFQGEKVGSGNQRKFMSLNAKALRNAIVNDINNNAATADAATACVVAPGSTTPVPNAYIISQGTYDQRLFKQDGNGGTHIPSPASESETVAEYCQRVGLIADDLYTIVVFAATPDEASVDNQLGQLASQPKCSFGFVRLRVKAEAFADTSEVTNMGQIFDVDASSTGTSWPVSTYAVGDFINPEDVIELSDYTAGAVGIIRSRVDSDLRSNTTMVFTSSYGIIAPYIIPVWAAGATQVGDSDLILEGGNF